MASTTEQGLFTFDDFASGDPGWGDELIANTLRHARVGFHLSVKDRDLTDPPGSPAAGDTYIPAATATGDWAAHEDDIAYFDGTDWAFYTPRLGWLCYIEDEEKLSVFKAAWSAGVAI